MPTTRVSVLLICQFQAASVRPRCCVLYMYVYIYICVFVCVCISICICTCVGMHVCTCIHTYVHVYIHMRIPDSSVRPRWCALYMYVCIYIYLYVCVRVYLCICTYAGMHVCTCIHTYVYIYQTQGCAFFKIQIEIIIFFLWILNLPDSRVCASSRSREAMAMRWWLRAVSLFSSSTLNLSSICSCMLNPRTRAHTHKHTWSPPTYPHPNNCTTAPTVRVTPTVRVLLRRHALWPLVYTVQGLGSRSWVWEQKVQFWALGLGPWPSLGIRD